MDTSELFTSCRKGELSRVRYLVEQRDVELNVKDKWDSTPLYYACLCGHEELVQYLLANASIYYMASQWSAGNRGTDM
ncbi:ankyrin repeat and BTB/POZ domain-containing protein 1-like [Rhincodon typus]|uniref:ankyrin repeat and BTB/POZ domain-containing protein 1-like n=1 Tax=Rhincodon typus TaxID=259920 RepID=UPI0020306164|nr:ankyrin repeat and BTB/POZ domain-containing protein 1-like [Rhincodon typus]